MMGTSSGAVLPGAPRYGTSPVPWVPILVAGFLGVSTGSGWYNLSSTTNSPERRSIQRPGPVSDSRPVAPLQWVVHSDNARSAGTSACCLGRGIPDQARIRGGVTLEESLGLEPAQPVAQESIRDARHGDADVAEPPRLPMILCRR